MLASFLGAVGCDVVITSFAAVEEETVDVSQRGELALGRSVISRDILYGGPPLPVGFQNRRWLEQPAPSVAWCR